MRWRTLPIELFLLGFFAVFLLYPLFYIFPGAVSDEEYEVRLLSLGEQPEAKAQVLVALQQAAPERSLPDALHLPATVRTFPPARKTNAQQLAEQLRQAGGEAEVVLQRHWTGFYFQQALGFTVTASSTFPFVRFQPNSPLLWNCLWNSLAI